MSDTLSASQTIGPFFHVGLPWPDGPEVVSPDTPGAIRLFGCVYDGAGQPVPDAMIETWQAGPDGRFDHPDDPRGPGEAFRGFGRCPTDTDGNWSITTLKPGQVPGPQDGLQAPHVDVSVFARGLLNRLVTRIYFSDEADANDEDPVLATVDVDRRSTLVAQREGDGYRFDIRLRGDDATVFFAL